MNIYSDSIYSDILEGDAVYNRKQRYQRKAKNFRRGQRKAKEAHRAARYDSFYTVHTTATEPHNDL